MASITKTNLLIAFLLFVAIGCKTTKTDHINAMLVNEIKLLKLENADTLVMLGSTDVNYMVNIKKLHPQIHFLIVNDENTTKGKSIKRVFTAMLKMQSGSSILKNSYTYLETPNVKLPLLTNSYKNVLCRMSLHASPNWQLLNSEATRILAPNGYLYIIDATPISENQKCKFCKNIYLNKEQAKKAYSQLKLIMEEDEEFSKKENVYILKLQKEY